MLFCTCSLHCQRYVPFAVVFFFFNDTATTEIYTLSLHDALPISHAQAKFQKRRRRRWVATTGGGVSACGMTALRRARDRKSTRLNSSHGYISYAVFCLKKKKPRLKATPDGASQGVPVQRAGQCLH